MKSITSLEAADDAMAESLVLIFKHSTRCPVSAAAYGEALKFMASHPGAPLRVVDVIAHRAVSMHITEQTGVEHESPQVLLMADGEVLWHASHSAITQAALEEKFLPLMKA